MKKIQSSFFIALLLLSSVSSQIMAMTRGREIVRAARAKLPALPTLPSLPSIRTPEAIQGYINRFTTVFRHLSPSTLRSIIANQTTQFTANMNAFIESKSVRIAAKIIAATAAIVAASIILAGAAAIAAPDIVPVGEFKVGEMGAAMTPKEAKDIEAEKERQRREAEAAAQEAAARKEIRKIQLEMGIEPTEVKDPQMWLHQYYLQ